MGGRSAVAGELMVEGSLAGKLDDPVDRVLVIELWNIGDVILTMPFLAQLRYVFPRARIALAAKSFADDLLSGTGLVDEIIVSDLSWRPSDSIGLRGKIFGLLQAGRALRALRFDIAFSGRDHLRERLLLGLSRARRRVAHSSSRGDSFLTDALPIASGPRHRVAAWLDLLGPLGGAVNVSVPRLHITDPERYWAIGYLESQGVSSGDFVVGIHPGASVAEKRWSLDGFREVAGALASQPGVRVVAFAEPGGYGGELFTIPGVIAARVSLRELIASISRCDLLVCNDSGPMHIAGALGVPTVALFEAGIPDSFAPLGEGHELVTSGENSESLLTIPASRVLEAVERVLAARRAHGISQPSPPPLSPR
ncbi:MAG: glycosyltransferase family 9 protein [Gemmatimonadaceae bacterium]